MTGLLLAHMPMADPRHPNLGMEQLAAESRMAGETVRVLYGNLLMPPVRPDIQSGLLGDVVFSPMYYDLDPEAVCEEAADCLGLQSEAREDFRVALLAAMDGAELCIDRCLAQVLDFDFDVTAFSVCFDNQKLASAALARAIKRQRPGCQVLFGGTGCDGEMARGVLRAFREVDHAFRGAAAGCFRRVLAHVRSGAGRESAPAGLLTRSQEEAGGIAATSGDSVIKSGQLPRAPAPDYAEFLAQREASGARGELRLLFETSRGCWWGRKSHCSFCGIAAIQHGYAAVAVEEARDIIVEMRQRWRPDLLYAADAIMDYGHIGALTPLLAAHRKRSDPDLRIFYEVKTNLRRPQLAALAAAGITEVQPGIESFSSQVLASMRKGCTGLQQVAFLKWAGAYGIRAAYGLLLGTPGESEVDVMMMADLCPRLHHLPPPVGIGSLSLHRFSPYVQAPAAHGIASVKPYGLQHVAYRAPPDVLYDLCYEFDFELANPLSVRHAEAVEQLEAAVAAWRHAYFSGASLTVRRLGDRRLVVRRSRADDGVTLWLDGPAAAVLDAIETPATAARAAEISGVDQAEAVRLLDEFAAHGLAIHMDGLWLGLPVPAEADAMIDAGFQHLTPSPEPALTSEVAS